MQRRCPLRSSPSMSLRTISRRSPSSNYKVRLCATTRVGIMTSVWSPSTSPSAAVPCRTSRGSILFVRLWKCMYSRPFTSSRKTFLIVALAARLDWMSNYLMIMTQTGSLWHWKITNDPTASRPKSSMLNSLAISNRLTMVTCSWQLPFPRTSAILLKIL